MVTIDTLYVISIRPVKRCLFAAMVMSSTFVCLNAAAQPAPTARADLEQITKQITQLQAAIPDPPHYYFETGSFSSAVSAVWTDLTGKLLGTDQLRAKYEDFYSSALQYRANAQLALIHARRYVKAGDATSAEQAIEEFKTSIRLFDLSESGAYTAWKGNMDAAGVLADGIYRGSKASLIAAKYLTKPLLGPLSPAVSSAIDSLFVATDFLVNSSGTNVPQAAKTAITQIAVGAVFRYVKLPGLGNRSMEKAIDDGVAIRIGQSSLAKALQQVDGSKKFKAELLSLIENSSSGAVQELTKAQIDSLVSAILAGQNAPAAVSPTSGNSATQVSSAQRSKATCSQTVVHAGLSGEEAVSVLGGTTEYARYDAISALVQNKRLRVPLCADEVALILNGTSASVRAASIAKLAGNTKADLSGAEAAAILGSPKELSEYDRYNAISALVQAGRFAASLPGQQLALILKGTSANVRAASIAKLASNTKADLSGAEAVVILGSPQRLSEYNRYNAISALVQAGRFASSLTGQQLALILKGTSGNARAASIAKLAGNTKADLSGAEAAAILGSPKELSEYDRYNAISALVQAGRFAPSLTGQQLTLVLQGTSGNARSASVSKLATSR